MGNFPLSEDETDIVEQNDGFTSPLQQYRTHASSSIVTEPVGPMWWSPGDTEPTLSGDLEISAEYDGGTVSLPEEGYVDTLELVDGDTFTVLE